MSEDDFLWQLIRKGSGKADAGLLRLLGWDVQHNSDSRKAHQGFPDIVAWKGNRLIFVELKKQTAWKWGPGQIETLDALERTGAEVYLWRPRDFVCIALRLEREEPPRSTSWREWFEEHNDHPLTKGQQV